MYHCTITDWLGEVTGGMTGGMTGGINAATFLCIKAF